MAKNTTFTITGLNEIKRAYRELPKTVANKVVRQAVRKAVKPIAAKVKELTPRDTGRLAKATKVRARKGRKRGTIAIDVVQEQAGNSFKDAVFHGGFVNYGTKKMTGRHYFERAFDETKDRAASDVESEVAAGIVREAIRLAR
jgi:HK97 gp10 family phage protein